MKNIILVIGAIVLLVSCGGDSKKDKDKSGVSGWAKEAVWYQIVPDRFYNGDSSNDPTLAEMQEAFPELPRGWRISPWTAEWYKLQSWENRAGKDFYKNAGYRRYGGDLQGVIDKLDYLENLGVNVIYFTPLFESSSADKYNAVMYRHIDNNFGPNPQNDKRIWENEDPADTSTWQWTSADSLFLQLIKKAHDRGIKVVLEGVFNRTDKQFWAFRDVIKNRENSKYVDWYTIKSFDDSTTKEDELKYKSWDTINGLPAFKQDTLGLVKGVRTYIKHIVERWMDPDGDGNPSDGIDGWCLDTAEKIDHDFWKDFRKWVKDINPEACIVGEVWWKDWQNGRMYNPVPWLDDEFDAVLNYRFTRAVKQYLFQKIKVSGPEEFADTLLTQKGEYPKENLYALINLLGSHDTERLATLIVNPDYIYDHSASPKDNPNFYIRKPNEEELAKLKLAVGIQMTLPGVPHIFYGDEAGMWGGDIPDNLKPMLWADMEFENDVIHPYDLPRQIDSVKFNSSLFNWYKTLIAIRKNNKELTQGGTDFIVIDEDKETLAYKRQIKDEEDDAVWVIINNSRKPYELRYVDPERLPMDRKVKDLITGKDYKFDNSIIKAEMEPYQILILK